MKLLVVRLSSMGDILLTTPILRALRENLPTAEIHFLLKKPYAPLLTTCPYVDHVISWGELRDISAYEWVIDLQKNLRTLPFRMQARRYTTFPKKNFTKWLWVRGWTKKPIPPIVERYAMALAPLGITLQSKFLEVFPTRYEIEEAYQKLSSLPKDKPRWGLGLSATYPTKRWLPAYFSEIAHKLQASVVLLGGEKEKEIGLYLESKLKLPCLNAVGMDIRQTIALMGHLNGIFTHDTGLMHIARALGLPGVIFWGNTSSAFGMGPMPEEPFLSLEVELPCRPCSKLGYTYCPKGHFSCMRALTPDWTFRKAQSFFESLQA
ncbi:MAG: glycosyltransferase family 9 protein [Bacteroidia bacterium]